MVTFRAPIRPEATGVKSKVKSREKSREKILSLIAASPSITTQEMAEAIGLSRAGIEKAIKKLKQEGCLKRIGPDKGGHWEVVG